MLLLLLLQADVRCRFKAEIRVMVLEGDTC